MSVLVVALEKVEWSSGSLIGSSIASLQKSTAPEVIFGMQNMLETNELALIVKLTIFLSGYRCCLHSWMKPILDQ